MSQRERTDKRNEFKIYKSYHSNLDSSLKDDSTSKVKSVSYSSGDQDIRYRNSRSSRKSHFDKSLKSPLVVRKDADLNDSGFRRNSDHFTRHKSKDLYHHRHHQDHFINSKNFRKEKPHCHKIPHHEQNNRGSESFREKRPKNSEHEGHFRRFSSVEVNKFSPKGNFICNLWNDNIKRNRIKDEERQKICNHEQKEKRKEIEEANLEGSARTRGFYWRKKEDRRETVDESKINSDDFRKKANTENANIKKSKNYSDYSNATKLSDFFNCSESNKNLNARRKKQTRRSKSQSAESKDQSKIGCRSRSRKVENLPKKCLELKAKTSFHSLNCKSLKIKQTEELKKQQIKMSNINLKNISKNKSISSPTTERSSKSSKSQESSQKLTKNYQSKRKITKENKNSDSLNSESENDQKNESIRKIKDSEKKQAIFNDDSNIKFNEDTEKREIQEIKKCKITNQKRKCKNRPNYRKTTLRSLLLYLIRKIVLSERQRNKSDEDKKIKMSKNVPCIRMKENKIESTCESSGYDSLHNIQDRISEIKDQVSEINKNQISEFIKNQDSETIFSLIKSTGPMLNVSNYLESEDLKKSCNDIEFLDSEKYCVYKVYKSSNGGILFKESKSQEFKRGEFVIGKRISKEPERLHQFSKEIDSAVPEKNSNQLLFSLRNNSTQTELNVSIPKMNTRKQNWFRKSSTKKCQVLKKHLTYLESTSNSSLPESLDFEQFNLPSKKNEKLYSPSSKKSLSHLPKPPPHFLKKSAAVDTSDLSYFISRKNPENKMIFLFNSSENEKNLGSNKECRFLNLNEKIKLEEQIRSSVFEKSSPQEYNFDSINRDNNFYSLAPPPSLIPVSWLKLDNSEFITHKTNIEEMYRVQMENNSNFLQSTELQIKRPELIYSESTQDSGLRKKKKSRKFFRIFKNKKKYDRIHSEEEKLKI